MVERPILFNGAMVRAILAGRKTQTRRAMKPQPVSKPHSPDEHWVWDKGARAMIGVEDFLQGPDPSVPGCFCPFGRPGDRLWVRETWMDLTGTGIGHWDAATGKPMRYAYGAESPPGSASDEARRDFGLKWRPSIHMPREACRLVLEITGVRVERLQGISEADALAEGIGPAAEEGFRLAGVDRPAGFAFRDLWTSTGGDWDSNPWVWVIEFKRIDSPQEASDA